MNETSGNEQRSGRIARDETAEVLIRRFQKGDREAMGELFRLYSREVYRILFSFIGNDYELEDLVQEVFIQLIKSLKNFEFKSRFSTWLYRLTINVALQEIRRRSARPQGIDLDSLPELGDDGVPLWERGQKSQMLQMSQRILETIDEKKRTAFILFEFGGYKLKEISDITDASLEAVKSRLHHARHEFYGAWDDLRKKEKLLLDKKATQE